MPGDQKLLRAFSGIDKIYVIKRDGSTEGVHVEKIMKRIRALCYGLNESYIDVEAVTRRVVAGLYPGVTTAELDNLAAEICATMTTRHYDYETLAARLAISNLHKKTKSKFSEVMEDLYQYIHPRTKRHSPLIAERVIEIIRKNAERLDSAIDYQRDFNYNYFGFRTLERSYLLKIKNEVYERPQHMVMRVSIGIHMDDIDGAIETYNLMSEKWFTHASPTLFNAGTPKPQLSSCFLLTMKEDSIEGIYDTLKQCAVISKNAGGVGLNVHCIRSLGTYIAGTNGESNGINRWGEEFEALYTQYEKEGRGRRTVRAQEVWHAIIQAQIETGNPFMLYKDACNRKSNQQNLGTIKCSNLCTEIVEYSSPEEIAVCNLASISVGHFVDPEKRTFDFEKLQYVTRVATRNLNKVIDVNFYPVEEAYRSNMRHRPIGLGVQGLADAFFLLRYPFDSPEAIELNRRIFETIYFAALDASCELAEQLGPYESYEGCPVSKGILQPDMWGVDTEELSKVSGLDWAGLRARIKKFGLRNSLLMAPMPTASTAQILGNTESIEPQTSNVYSRRVLSGEFQIVNPYLLRDLIQLDLWSEELKSAIVANQGSIQHIQGIPENLKQLYKTVWEISQKTLIDMAAARGPFIDQSQSLNLYLAQPSYGRITSMHFYGWKKGLKTGMYYLRTRPAADPIKFTIDKTSVRALMERGVTNTSNGPTIDPEVEAQEEARIMEEIKRRNAESITCSLNNPEGCLSCQG
ncbi:unnamed protein product [Echinostoma caproni]|uniref:Ribonucleoside-diphosphate reductase n=1 Tax=Echinostoma caproni TaxID=27848 RepID=A0A183B517_9TREM|nr:unnamed protein product [Echinostoma caproni]